MFKRSSRYLEVELKASITSAQSPYLQVALFTRETVDVHDLRRGGTRTVMRHEGVSDPKGKISA